MFLPGNHSIQNRIDLDSISNITLRANNNKSEVNIICMRAVIILCQDVTNLNVERLSFILYQGNDRAEEPISAAVIVIRSTEISFSYSAFIGTGNSNNTLVRALYCGLSDISVFQCIFKENTGDTGGAIFSQSSNITILGGIFIGNIATNEGGAIYADESSIRLIDTSKAHDSSIPERNLNFEANCTYSNTTALLQWTSRETESSYHILHFSDNMAQTGGAIYMYKSRASLHGNVIKFTSN